MQVYEAAARELALLAERIARIFGSALFEEHMLNGTSVFSLDTVLQLYETYHINRAVHLFHIVGFLRE